MYLLNALTIKSMNSRVFQIENHLQKSKNLIERQSKSLIRLLDEILIEIRVESTKLFVTNYKVFEIIFFQN